MRITPIYQFGLKKSPVHKKINEDSKQVQNINNFSSVPVSFSSGYPAGYNDLNSWHGYAYETTKKERFQSMSIDEAIQDLKANYNNSRPDNIKDVAFENVIASLGARLYDDSDALVSFANLYAELHPKTETDTYKLDLLHSDTTIRTGCYHRKTGDILSQMRPGIVLEYVEKIDMSPETLYRFLTQDSGKLMDFVSENPEENSERVFTLFDKVINDFAIPDIDARKAKLERIKNGEEPKFTKKTKTHFISNDPQVGSFSMDYIRLIDKFKTVIPKDKADEYNSIRENLCKNVSKQQLDAYSGKPPYYC